MGREEKRDGGGTISEVYKGKIEEFNNTATFSSDRHHNNYKGL